MSTVRNPQNPQHQVMSILVEGGSLDGGPSGGQFSQITITGGVLTDLGNGRLQISMAPGAPPGADGEVVYNDGGTYAGAPNLKYDKTNDLCVVSGFDSLPGSFGYGWFITETGSSNAVLFLGSNTGVQADGAELSSLLDVGFELKATGVGGVRGTYSFGRRETFNHPYVCFGVSTVAGGGDGAIQIRKAYVAPAGALDPNLGFLYVNPATGALHYLSPAGTNTPIGPA